MIAVVAAVLVGATPASAAEPMVVADGHVDLGPRFVDGTWRVQLRDDTVQPATWRDLSDVVLHAVDAATVTVPADPAFAFLGRAGATVWVLPQTQQAGILWPGWNTQDPSVIERVSREVTWRLHQVDGPGHFALFLTGNFGAPEILFDSAKSYPQETGIEVGSHVHGNWAFGAPGTYKLNVEMLATTVDGAAVTDRRTLRIFVGPGDPAAAFPAPSSTPMSPTSFGAPVPQASADSGGGPWIAIGGGGLAVVVIGGFALLWRRRRAAS